MKIITPWLSSEYLRRVYKDDKGHILLEFRDGVKEIYQIENCTEERLNEVLEGFKGKGIQVEE
jgi:hypothetical protein